MTAINALSTYNLNNSRSTVPTIATCATWHAPCMSVWRATMTRTERPAS